MAMKHTQSLEVADLVTNQGMTLAEALHQVLNPIRDGSRPRTSVVADEAREIISARQEGTPTVTATYDLFTSWQELDEIAITAITDNGGSTVDRYTAVFRDGDCLGFNESPTHPLGFSQWCGEHVTASDVEEWIAKGETLITDVPDWMQKHLLWRMNEAYRDGLEGAVSAGKSIEEARDAIFAECFTCARFDEASMGISP
ncbi:hypothetical protein ACVIGB_001101 [Bradyrhizobium sp. USDA 4341]